MLHKLGLAELIVDETEKKASIAELLPNGKSPDPEKSSNWGTVSGICRIGTVSRTVWLTVFFLGMFAVMAYKYSMYCCHLHCRPDAFDLMNYGVCFARSGSQGTMWCVFWLLWPVCRNFLVNVRLVPGLWRVIPFDDRILFHKVAAWALLFCTLVHVVAHLYNYSQYSTADTAIWAKSVLGKHSGLDPQPAYWEVALKTLPGLTGHGMLLTMGIAYALVIPSVNQRCWGGPCFNGFWYSHKLLLLFLAMFIAHGTREWLETSYTWLWCIFPLTIYFVQEVRRWCRPSRHARVLEARVLKGGVVNLVFEKPAFLRNFKAGMYLNLKVPRLSKFEWHPFTISSAPSDEFITLHIRACGDWTNALLKLVERTDTPDDSANRPDQAQCPGQPADDGPNRGGGCPGQERSQMLASQFAMELDGPYGAPSEAFLEYQVVMLVGAGIGVTPFLSVIREITNLWSGHRIPPTIAEHIQKAQAAIEAASSSTHLKDLEIAQAELEAVSVITMALLTPIIQLRGVC